MTQWNNDVIQKGKMSEVEEIMKRISSHKGVTGAIIIDKEGKHPMTSSRYHYDVTLTHNHDSFLGIPIRSTLDNSTTVQYAGLIMQLTNKARSTVSMTSL